MMPVSGCASVTAGGAGQIRARLDLTVDASGAATTTRRAPSGTEVRRSVEEGTLVAHPSKVGLTPAQYSCQVATIVRCEFLPKGSWNDACQDRLVRWLAAQKRQRLAISDGQAASSSEPARTDPNPPDSPESSSSDSDSGESTSSSSSSSSRGRLNRRVAELEDDLWHTNKELGEFHRGFWFMRRRIVHLEQYARSLEERLRRS